MKKKKLWPFEKRWVKVDQKGEVVLGVYEKLRAIAEPILARLAAHKSGIG